MKRLFSLTLVLLALAYPFAVYYGAGQLSPRFFAVLLATVWLARLLVRRQDAATRGMALAALGFCALLLMWDEPALLHWYPVLINAGLLAVFALSLCQGRPMIERIARLREPDLPPQAVRYTRRVTQVWTLFFLLNGMIAAALTLYATRHWWLLYNGGIAYGLMGLLLTGEWLLRQRMRRRA